MHISSGNFRRAAYRKDITEQPSVMTGTKECAPTSSPSTSLRRGDRDGYWTLGQYLRSIVALPKKRSSRQARSSAGYELTLPCARAVGNGVSTMHQPRD